jgi:large subunit ribosomal protein L6
VFPSRIKVSLEGNTVIIERGSDEKRDCALHGLTRSIVANMVTGVSQGYTKVLSIVGVGYKAQVLENKIVFSLGYSHPVEFPMPDGIKATVDQKQVQLTLTGIDKQKIGQFAANIRKLRPPDVYKGKGVRYAGERLKLKVGKAGKK